MSHETPQPSHIRLTKTLTPLFISAALLLGTVFPLIASSNEGGTITNSHDLAKSQVYDPQQIAGSVITHSIGEPSCGPGWPAANARIVYRGGVVATKTLILATSGWSRGYQIIDDLQLPENAQADWKTQVAVNPNYPVPALPTAWRIILEATDNATHAQLLNVEKEVTCPSYTIEPSVPIQNKPLTITLNNANADEFKLRIGDSKNVITNTNGAFVFTPTATGTLLMYASAVATNLRAETIRKINLTVEPPSYNVYLPFVARK